MSQLTAVPPSQMRGRPALLAFVATLLVAFAAPSPPSALARDVYCSSTGDFCIGANRVNGTRVLRLDTFSFRGTVRVCVDPPRGREKCVYRRLKRSGPGYGISVRWSSSFPNHGRGSYFVRFYTHGDRVGQLLSFSL
jgi:hypothetical protein